MKRSGRFLAITLATALTAGLTACGGGSAAPAASSTAGSTGDAATTGSEGTTTGNTAAEGPDLNIMLETAVQSLDPQIATDGTSFEVIHDYTDGLMQLNAEGQPIPAIAESYEISEDGLTYTFHLRDDALWSNGEPVTAADFVYGWQRAVDPELASEYSYMLSDIGQVKNAAEIIAGELPKEELGVTAVDDTTLEVQLNVPVTYFLSLMNFSTYFPVNQAFCEVCGDTFATSPETVLANGAFILDSYEPAATSFHLSKNPDYYNADHIQLGGLNYQVIQDSQQALMSYQSGDLDITVLNGEQIDQVSDDPEFMTRGAGFLWYISPNIAGVPELSNLNIRMALTHALDRDAITGDVLKDGSMPTLTAVPAQFAAGPDGSDFSEDQTMFSDVCSYDPEKAAQFWAAGLEELGITELTLDMVVDSDDAPQKVAQVLKEEWETTLPGFTVNLVIEPKKQRQQDMTNGEYQLGLTRWGPDYADPMTYLGMWVTGNSNNKGRWSNAEYDSIIQECSSGSLCTDPEGRWAAMYDAERIVMEEAVIFPLYTQAGAKMISSRVSGVEYHSVGTTVYKNAVKTE